MKNAQHIKKIAPHLISKEKGLTDVISMETLRKLDAIDDPHDVIQNKELADQYQKINLQYQGIELQVHFSMELYV